MIQNRQSERIEVTGSVRLRNMQGEVQGKLLNISERGFGISTTYTFSTHERVSVVLETGDVLKGKIAWTAMGKIGVELEERMSGNLVDKISKKEKILA